MAFKFLSNIPLGEARASYMSALLENGMAPQTEMLPVSEAVGRITAAPIYALRCSPHYHACAMDGIALSARVTFGACESSPLRLNSGQYIPVDTGDPLPQGCDAVVMIEDVVSDGEGVKLYAAAAPWQHVRQIGEDVCAGDMLLPSFTEITPAAVGAVTAGGVLEAAVVRRPVVGIIPTGDEIVPPGVCPEAGEIPEFNSAIFSGMLRAWGAVPRTYPIVRDDPALMVQALRTALADCDAVLLNAGSSAGRDDYAAEAIAEVGEVICHGIAIRPGKPAVLGAAGAKPILGVPGYPVSGIIVVEELLKPILDLLRGLASPPAEYAQAQLSRAVTSSLKYREFIRVRLGMVGGGLTATPLPRGAGVVTSFMKADGILEIPQDSEGVEAGSTVSVRLLRPLAELRDTLIITGSHDPLIDEIADILRRADHGAGLSSSHVGSMGGVMAVKRGECHAAGVHLLDGATGVYNESYIEKYFPDGGVCLVECVYREQGLMTAPGNPKGIRCLSDMAAEGMSYVNRQKGSGTRLLCDWVCSREGVRAESILGYDREEYTHTAVAALVAAGSADAGLGIYSAARLYGLDFVPVCREQYDLLVPTSEWETKQVRRLIETLKSAEFRRRLEAMGGYTLNSPGELRKKF
ncbi:MAG: molybdopterin biosynthesis protein [Oscillospiraceae bacterium]